MSPIIKAAAVQISPVLCSPQGTVEKVVKKIREYIAGPEQRRLLHQAMTVQSPATDAMGEAAKQAG